MQIQRKVLKDYYAIEPGRVYALIHYDDSGTLVYEVIEPPLTEEDKKILSTLVDKIRERIFRMRTVPIEIIYNKSREKIEKIITEEIEKTTKELKLDLTSSQLDKYLYYIKRDIVGFGKLDPLMKDPYIEDINVNGPGRPVYVWHAKYEHLKTNIVFETAEELYSYIVKISQLVGKNISSANPILEGLIANYARVEAALADIAPLGHILNIRKFRIEPFTVIDLIELGTLSPEAVAYLWLMVDYRKNIIILGPTGSGKTTLLNALLYLIRPEVRIVTIEDTREISIPHDQWVALVTRPSISSQVREITQFELVKMSMRIRPDYLIVGEIRGEEAYALFQAFASGHAGLTTIHADSISAAILRLISKPMNVPKPLLKLANIFINIQRIKVDEKITRRVVEICEFSEYKSKPEFITMFRYNVLKDYLEMITPIEESKIFKEISREKMLTIVELKKEFIRRKELLKSMVKYRFRDPSTVFRIIRAYYRNPEDTFHKVLSGILP